jgi:hypothetical protein
MMTVSLDNEIGNLNVEEGLDPDVETRMTMRIRTSVVPAILVIIGVMNARMTNT